MVKFRGVTRNITNSFVNMYRNMEKKITTIGNILSVSHEYITYWSFCEFKVLRLAKIEICISKTKKSRNITIERFKNKDQ